MLDKPSATQSNGIGVKEALAFHVKDTLVKTFGDIVLDADPMIAPAGKPEFGRQSQNALPGREGGSGGQEKRGRNRVSRHHITPF